MAEVRKVRKIKQASSSTDGLTRIPIQPTSSDDLIPDEMDDLEELEDDLEELFDNEPSLQEEPPESAEDKEREAAALFERQKRERALQKLEEGRRSKKVRKVSDPKKEMWTSVSIVVITLLISLFFGYLTWEDYKGDADSRHVPETYTAIKEGRAWFLPDNCSVVDTNVTGSFTGDDAARDYKECFLNDGKYSFTFGIFELNWIYYLVLAIVCFTGPNGVVRRSHNNRLKAKEEKFPDFIRDLAEFWKGGLSMKVAVDTLAKGDYGALDEEVEFMATQLSWGVAFNEVMRMFLERVHTGLIERSIALIEEANKAGGKISDILLNVAHDAQEIKLMDRQREGTMKSYIFVTFVSFLIYVIIILVMSYVFLPAIAESTEDLQISGSFAGIKIGEFEPAFIALLFFASILIQSIGGGVNAGIMGEGNLGAGLWYITLFTLLGAGIFQLAGVAMGLN